jgi:hypothetical protein
MGASAKSLRSALAAIAVLGVGGSVLAFTPKAAADEVVQVCGPYANGTLFGAIPNSAFRDTVSCPDAAYSAGGFSINVTSTTKGQAGKLQIVAPPGLALVGATATGIASAGLNDGGDYGGGLYWSSGSVETNDQTARTPSLSVSFPASNVFGMQVVCGKGSCTAPAQLNVGAYSLQARETVGPSLNSPSGLWQTSGWIRGTWPFVLSSDSPSGVCLLAASLSGRSVGETTSGSDPSVWPQCSAAPISNPAVDTTQYSNGAAQLGILAADAAAVHAALTKTVYIDNQQPTVALSGTPDVPSTLGTQFVTAAAAAGPSSVAGISCSVDGSAAQWYTTNPAEVPVTGPGQHAVTCTSTNNAVDTSGAHATSAPATFSLKIGVPTVAAVAFSKVVDKLRCRRVTARVRIPARWVKVRVRGRIVRIREKAHTEKVKITRCHPRTVRRRVTRRVTIRRHGKKVRVKRTRTVRVVLEPRTVFKTTRRVRHGHGTTVSGWLGTTTGTALGGQTIDVLTAADNGRENFHVADVATTAANGGWSARLDAGPSRLIEAAYPGAASTEGAVSAPAHLIVPAKVQLLSVSPRLVAWGGVVHLVGRLKGGYLPRGGALVRLRIGLGHSDTTYGVREHVSGNGRFTTDYTFGAGDPAAHRSFWFQLASLPMGNYPYAPASSRGVTVRVGGHPKPPPAVHRRHRR